MLSPLEIGGILGVVVLLFGVKRLPELGSGMGQAISNFRKSYREGNAIDGTPTEEKKSLEDTKKSNEKVGNEDAHVRPSSKETV
jgi:sec-independent protein translocase protein TatA